MQTNSNYWFSVLSIVVAAISLSCSSHVSYEEILREELSKEVREDSLFYGLYFNMTTPAFLDHCTLMNQRKIFYQNGFSSEVIIRFEDQLKFPASFVFHPNLEKHLIQVLRGRFRYEGRNPFSKERGAEVLIKDLVKQFEEWYGGRKFIEIWPEEKWKPAIYVKVDSNRKITLEQDVDTGEVYVVYEDLKPIM
ncbi:MAG: hypothetical protein MI975_16020 [Cytophagales bacterium]|nr:hypothetical protein [Cytophagales bacterium]